MLFLATFLSFALAVAVAPLARYAYRQVGAMPAPSRVTIHVGTVAVWAVTLTGGLVAAWFFDLFWVPCAIAASCVVGMLALVVFTMSAKEEQQRWREALAKLGASGPFNEQPLSTRFQVWVMTMDHDGVMSRAVRVLVPVLLALLVAMWWFFEGVDW